MDQMEKARQIVQVGAGWLEFTYGPDWRSRITRPLKLSGTSDCVLAQVAGMAYCYAAGLHDLSEEQEQRYGFTGPAAGLFHEDYLESRAMWEALEYAWMQEIARVS